MKAGRQEEPPTDAEDLYSVPLFLRPERSYKCHKSAPAALELGQDLANQREWGKGIRLEEDVGPCRHEGVERRKVNWQVIVKRSGEEVDHHRPTMLKIRHHLLS